MPFGYGIGPGNYEIPIVIQDRQFNATTGDFLYPTMPPGAGTIGECGEPETNQCPTPEWPNSTGPWIGEYFGDEMLVNGVCSPVLDVKPAIYRFRILNGCNARFLNLTFQNGRASAGGRPGRARERRLSEAPAAAGVVSGRPVSVRPAAGSVMPGRCAAPCGRP
jgi:FtsP/CotA-like multicopper oxidase with cupredoxin domain